MMSTKYSKKNNDCTDKNKTIQRIFFPHVTISDINDELISSYKTNQITMKKLIYSREGIFELKDNSIWKMIPNDVYINNNNNNNNKILIDKSKWVKKDVWYQIPFDHIHVTSFRHVYKLSNKSMVECVIEKNEQGDIIDFFMETEFSINVKGIKEDILTFLYALKF